LLLAKDLCSLYARKVVTAAAVVATPANAVAAAETHADSISNIDYSQHLNGCIMNKLCDASEGGVRIARGYTETDVVSECTTLATTTQAGGLLGSCRANVSPEHWNRIH